MLTKWIGSFRRSRWFSFFKKVFWERKRKRDGCKRIELSMLTKLRKISSLSAFEDSNANSRFSVKTHTLVVSNSVHLFWDCFFSYQLFRSLIWPCFYQSFFLSLIKLICWFQLIAHQSHRFATMASLFIILLLLHLVCFLAILMYFSYDVLTDEQQVPSRSEEALTDISKIKVASFFKSNGFHPLPYFCCYLGRTYLALELDWIQFESLQAFPAFRVLNRKTFGSSVLDEHPFWATRLGPVRERGSARRTESLRFIIKLSILERILVTSGAVKRSKLSGYKFGIVQSRNKEHAAMMTDIYGLSFGYLKVYTKSTQSLGWTEHTQSSVPKISSLDTMAEADRSLQKLSKRMARSTRSSRSSWFTWKSISVY